MKGKHRVIVSAKRLKYEFELWRNLTIIRGDSATGKTTLIDMIREYVNNPAGSPVELVCDKKCYVVEGSLWKGQLAEISDSIIFIDEGNDFIKTEEFAGEIQKTDNYYVIVTRESLPNLPYGAAFGSEIDRVLRLIKECKNAALYLPESFEWLILSAGILKNNYVDEVLDAPYNYVESEKFFSWERFFTDVLIDETKDTYLAYMKKKLNQAYLQDVIKNAILGKMEKINLTWNKQMMQL